MTLFTDSGHVIAYEENTSSVHQDLIIAHELGHILFDHRAVDVGDDESSLLLMPALRPNLVRNVMGRRTGSYSQQEEREAETMATILLEEASQPGASDGPAELPPGEAEIYKRLQSLEHPGW